MKHQHQILAALSATIITLSTCNAFGETLPQPDHVVVVIMENHTFTQIINLKRAPFIYSLAKHGALFVNAFAVTHPSQPNYFALFSGSTHGAHNNGYYMFDLPSLAGTLRAAGKTFVGYVETGSPRKHIPWESFVDARSAERNLSEFPADFTQLPTVSFIVPNNLHDMHNGSVSDGDAWLKLHLGAYAQWTLTHNSLLIVTFDEDDSKSNNRIPVFIYGSDVRPGRYDERITHYSLLSTLQAMYGLQPLARTAAIRPIYAIWKK